MVKCSNSLVGILNIITLLQAFPIIIGGVWLSKQAQSECERFLDKPVIVLGVFILLLSIAGLVGSCCKVSWMLWVYLLVMFVLILGLFCFTIFAFVVTRKGGGHEVSGRGYKEYRLGDYSTWLQKRANNNWTKIRSCLADGKVCKEMIDSGAIPVVEFYSRHLNAFESGCCKPPENCNFAYENPTTWTKNTTTQSSNPDCGTWSNEKNELCYGCESCKAGLLDSIKSDWKKVSIVNIIFIVFLIIVYSIGCCAFRNNKEDKSWKQYP